MDKYTLSLRRVRVLVRMLLKNTPVIDLKSPRRQHRLASRLTGRPGLETAKKPNRWGMIILYVFLFGYLAFISAAMGYVSGRSLSFTGQAELLPAVLTTASAMLALVFGFFYVISVFYHSDDLTTLLYLPFKPAEIMIGKFAVTLIYEYVMNAAFLLPAFIAGGIGAGFGAHYYVLVLLAQFFMPVAPLAVMTFLVVLLMRFAPFAKNKDRFNTISSIVILVLVLAGSMFFSLNSQNSSASSITGGVDLSGLAGSKLNRALYLFPGLPLLVKSLAQSRVWPAVADFVLFVLLALLTLAVMLLLGQGLYISGLTAMNQGGHRRRLSRSRLGRALKPRAALLSLMSLDWKQTVRTPAFLMNCVLGTLIVPIVFLISGIAGLIGGLGQDFSLSWLAQAGRYLGRTSPVTSGQAHTEAFVLGIVVIAVNGVLAFLSSINGMAPSALSREGQNAYYMKLLPASYNRQVLAKWINATLVTLLPGLLLIVAAAILLRLPFYLSLYGILVMLSWSGLSSSAGILLDLYRPRLTWDNETQAVKNNLGVLLANLLIILLAGIGVGLQLLLFLWLHLAALWLLLAGLLYLLLANILLIWLLRRQAPRLLRQLEF
ncbi:hypothetical protein HCH52_04585 [Oscillospiraceae bacterium HV4-5-C5C]|nr:hypothetical protein [Oscillospiraceae bacterium HV4-5-C5C]